MSFSEQVAGNVRAEIVRAGKDKKDLESILGLKHRAVNARWEGEAEFSFSDIEKIAKALGISRTQLLATNETHFLALAS